MAKRTRGSGQPGNRPNAARPQPKEQRGASVPAAGREAAVPPDADETGPIDDLPELDELDELDEPAGQEVEVVRPTGRLSKSEIDRAATLEAEIVAREHAAEQASGRSRSRSRRSESESRREVRGLAAQASQDYTYVGRDLRRVVVVNGSILALLIAAWVFVNVAHVGPF